MNRVPVRWVALLAGAFAYQLGWSWLAPVARIVGQITNDDTFLYLEFARNTIASGFPTFDGIHRTNGVQPLWGGLLVLLAALIEDRTLLLRCVLTLCTLLNFATGLVLLRCAGRVGSGVSVGVIGLCWSAYLLSLSPALLGMENSLHALLAALVILVWIGLREQPATPPVRGYLLLGVLLALNAGARLDSAVVSAVFAAAALWHGRSYGAGLRSPIWLVLSPLVLGAGAYAALSWVWFDAVLPVSGSMKRHYAAHYLDGAPAGAWPVYVAGAVLKSFFAAPQRLLAGAAPEAIQSVVLGVSLGVVGIPLLLRLAASRLVARGPAGGLLSQLCRLLAAAALLHLLVLAIAILHFSVDAWYHSWLYLAWLMGLAWGMERWAASPVLARPLRRALPALLAVSLVLVQIAGLHVQWTGRNIDELHVARLKLSERLDEILPADVRAGAWNSGILAYFTDRTLINLDGLMNSAEYARWIRSRGDLRQKLRALGIRVIVDYNDEDSTMPTARDWDRATSFRGLWNWGEVTVLSQVDLQDGKDLYVLQLPL